ncbi:MAG TPA: hypothetical protein VI911_07760 [Patescibacteria group bacterium]|nr:hypothetical protein [Patescibacteria group bacterium]
MFDKIIKLFNKLFTNTKTYFVRPYVVIYLTSIGAWTILESEYRCFACCKYHAYLQFIKDTKDEYNHYSARENRTPLTYHLWKEDIKEDTWK